MRAATGARRVALAAAAGVSGSLLLARRRTARRPPGPAARRLAAWTPPPPAGPLGRVAAYAWAAPVTVAGLLAGAAAGVAPRRHDGVLLFARSRGPAAWLLRRRGFAATAIGHVVVAVGEPSAALLAHELAHTRQTERLGPLMAPVYLGLLAVYGYRRHPLELAAARAAGRHSPSAGTAVA